MPWRPLEDLAAVKDHYLMNPGCMIQNIVSDVCSSGQSHVLLTPCLTLEFQAWTTGNVSSCSLVLSAYSADAVNGWCANAWTIVEASCCLPSSTFITFFFPPASIAFITHRNVFQASPGPEFSHILTGTNWLQVLSTSWSTAFTRQPHRAGEGFIDCLLSTPHPNYLF